MSPEAWLTLGVLSVVLVLLMFTRLAPYVVLGGGLTVLLTAGVVSERQVLEGAANPGVAAVAVLFAVVAGIRETGVMSWLMEPLLGRPRHLRAAQARVMGPVAVLSALLNNTPLVAVMLPLVHDWSRKHGLSISKLLIPLSFASILGGMCTLIGTSTTLLVDGLMRSGGADSGLRGLGMFEIAAVGLPIAFSGLAILWIAGPWLLPDRKPPVDPDDDARHYTVEMTVEPGGPLVGKTVEAAGLRHLPGLFLVEIDREEQTLVAPSSTVMLKPNDRLVFAGVVESVVDLQKIRGLQPATEQVFKLSTPRNNRVLVEAVVSDTCPLIGRSIRDGRFRTRYNAAVIAVARNGERMNQKIGDIVVRPGDTLLLEARASFAAQQRNSRDFYLVSAVEDSTPVRHDRAPVAMLILLVMVGAVAMGWISLFNAALLAAGAMLITRCTRTSAALRAVDWQLMLSIVAAFGIGRAMEVSGAAGAIADTFLTLAGTPHAALGVVLVLTMAFTNLMTNNAAAVLMFPVAVGTAAKLQVSPMPFAVAVAIAASMSFLTPIGYQTNLMVYGPGGYRFGDYLRVGLPLTVVGLLIAWWVIPTVWAF